MQERQREAVGRGPARGGGFWDGGTDDPGTATVSHGPYAERLPVVGLAIGQVRERFSDRFDIDPVSQAYVDGSPVSDDTTIRTGQLVVFMRPAGEKGPGR